MPPEPVPWDRKELRKHKSGGGGGGGNLGFGVGGGGPRWREPPFPHHHPYNHNHHRNNHHGGAPPRWLPDFRYRAPSGHGKQGGRHLYHDDVGHGFMASRANGKIIDDVSCRPSGSGRYGRSNRENRGSFSQKDCKSQSSETSSLPNSLRRPNNTSDQRSVNDMPSKTSSVPSSIPTNSLDRSQHEEQHDINGAVAAVCSTGPKLERENSPKSIDWKHLKWTRSVSLSSRGSGLTHSCSSKSLPAESNEMKVESMAKNVTSIQSATGDASAACVTSVAPSEEMNSRKKPRIGWGEGLAKYEKKKVEVPDESVVKNGAAVCDSSLEPGDFQAPNSTDKSAGGVGFSDNGSPATPSSVACSSSPGLGEKVLVKARTFDHDSANLCSSPSVLSQNHSAGSTFNLENLDLTSFSDVNLSISELLQSDDPSSVDYSFVSSTSMNKLLVLKNDVSKVLETTESEIDRLENELKSLISERENIYACLATSSSLPENDSRPCEDYSAASSITLRPTLQLVPPGGMLVENAGNAPKDDQDVDSPGSATSKFVEILSSGKDVCPTDVLKGVGYIVDPDENKSEIMEVEPLMDDFNEEKASDFSAPVEPQLMVSSSATTSGDDILESGREGISYELILASNRDCAHRATEVFNKILPTSDYHFDISSVASTSSLEHDSLEERFLRRKRFLRLKEIIITLKFKMFQHLWKEDSRLLPLKKIRAKSQRKFAFSLRTVSSGYQKHRSLIRSRHLSTASTLSLEPTTEMLNYARRLLSEPQVKPHRNMLKMPAIILDKQERMASRFISSNRLVEDPCAVEKERSLINPWTSEETKVFLDKLALFGKDFRKIASFLDHKTTADCIEFYYKNHKSDSFKRTKKKPDQAKSCAANTYLIAPRKRRNREANTVSLDMLGAASALAANVDDSVKIQQNFTSTSFFALSSSSRTPRGDDRLLERSSSLDLYNDERETVAADVLAGICGSLSSEAMGSCITSSIDPGEGYQEWRYKRVGSSTRRPLTPYVTQNVDDETSSGESCGDADPTDWTDEEKSLLIQAVSSYGKDFAMISRFVRTRSQDQCKVFFSKARKCLGLDMICPGPGNLVTDDATGGGSDMEDACIVETGPVCSEKSGFKMDKDIPSPDMKSKPDPDQVGMTSVKPDLNRVEDENEVGDIDFTDTILVSKNLISNDCQMEDKAELDFDSNSGIRNGASSELISVQGQENVLRNSDQEAAQGVRGANDHNLPNVGGTEASGDVNVNSAYIDGPTTKLEGQGLVLREDNLNVDIVVKSESCLGDINGVSCSLQDNQLENHQAANDSHSAADTNLYGIQQKSDSELDSAIKPHVSARQENNCFAPLVARPRVSSTTKHGKSRDSDSSVLGMEIRDEHRHKASRTNGHLSAHSSVEHLESSCILRGFPVPVTTMKEMSGDISFGKSIPFQSFRQSDGINFDRYSARDSFLQRCNGSKLVSSDAELSLPSQEQSRDCSRPTSVSPSNVAPCSKGDVKLFGQILSTPCQQKSNASGQRNEDYNTQHHNVIGKLSKVKSSSNQTGDRDSAPVKNESNNFGGSENLAPNVDFWDRNTMQNGFSSLSDSSKLLAKYPSAFGKYVAPSSKVDHLPSHAVGKNGECSLNGVSVFPARDICDSNALADFQVYRNQELLQPFTIDTRQRNDILFSEMQRSGGFDVVSGMQQQSRGMVGFNVVGHGGVFVGGQCTAVSDPVAAIRMHYAKSEQFSGQTGNNIVREDDSWRDKGNKIGS